MAQQPPLPASSAPAPPAALPAARSLRAPAKAASWRPAAALAPPPAARTAARSSPSPRTSPAPAPGRRRPPQPRCCGRAQSRSTAPSAASARSAGAAPCLPPLQQRPPPGAGSPQSGPGAGLRGAAAERSRHLVGIMAVGCARLGGRAAWQAGVQLAGGKGESSGRRPTRGEQLVQPVLPQPLHHVPLRQQRHPALPGLHRQQHRKVACGSRRQRLAPRRPLSSVHPEMIPLHVRAALTAVICVVVTNVDEGRQGEAQAQQVADHAGTLEPRAEDVSRAGWAAEIGARIAHRVGQEDGPAVHQHDKGRARLAVVHAGRASARADHRKVDRGPRCHDGWTHCRSVGARWARRAGG